MIIDLSSEIILQKTKESSLSNIKNLNLWGQSISNISVCSDLINVEVVSLSRNCIASLKPFAKCKHLRELYLRKNLIEDLSEIKSLQALPALRVLWLSDNPISKEPNYRPYIIAHLPLLAALDDQAITDAERSLAKKLIPVEDLPNIVQPDPRNCRILRACLSLIEELDAPSLETLKQKINELTR